MDRFNTYRNNDNTLELSFRLDTTRRIILIEYYIPKEFNFEKPDQYQYGIILYTSNFLLTKYNQKIMNILQKSNHFVKKYLEFKKEVPLITPIFLDKIKKDMDSLFESFESHLTPETKLKIELENF